MNSMKPVRLLLLTQPQVALFVGLSLLGSTLQAAPFLYSSGDLLLAFRQTGNADDLVVNVGSFTNYNAVPENTTLPIVALSAELLTATFPSLNGVTWSVSGTTRSTLNGFPSQSLWATAPRLVSDVPANAWLRKGQFVQGNAASQIDAVGANAAAFSSRTPAGPGNTATGVAIPVSNEAAFSQLIGTAGDFAGSFQGTVENTTADDFDGDPSNVSRSDLFELAPGTTAGGTINTAGRHLGYFELKPDGTLVFSTQGAVVPPPVIKSVTRVGDQTSIAFDTVAGATYRLRAVSGNALTQPLSTWPVGSSLVGAGTEGVLQDTSNDPVRFYAVEVNP